jgi:enediyne biosynthesis protein E4
MMDRRTFVLSLAGCAAGRWLSQTAKTKSLPTFIDASSKSGVHFRHQSSRTSQKYLPESMGAGVAMFDYDNDGYQDLFFVNGAKF